jgi:hypothetical protein
MKLPGKKVLLFSSPRSGSTFLSNIVRSHPEVIFFNELFTRAPKLLPRFEGAFQTSRREDWRSTFEHDLERLWGYKLPWWGNVLHRSRLTKVPVFLTAKLLASLSQRAWGENWGTLHRIYHINALVEPPWGPFWATQFPKASASDVLLVKDVRMSKAYFAFKEMYPDAFFIYLVRNPYFVVASEVRRRPLEDVLRWLDRGYLRDQFGQPDLVDRFFGRSAEHTFAVTWRLENELVWSDMQKAPPANLVVARYEDLALASRATAQQVFDFIGLDLHQNTLGYLDALTTIRPHQVLHDRSTFVGADMRGKLEKPGLDSRQLLHVAEVLEGSPLLKFWEPLPAWMSAP